MSRITTFVAAAALVVVGPSVARAQACQGYASFASGAVQVGAGIDFPQDAKQYGVGIGFGVPAGAFINGQVGRLDYDDVDESSTVFGANAGYQMQVGASGMQLCPVASFTYISGPNDVDVGTGVGMDISGHEFGLGLAIGAPFAGSPTLGIVPFGGVSYRRASLDVENSPFGDLDGSEDYGLVDLGVGFVLRSTITLRPSVSIPFAVEDGDTVFGLRASMNFGSRR